MAVRIALDAMGGDRGPLEAVAGAVQAVAEIDDLEVILFGDQQIISAALHSLHQSSNPRLSIVHTSQVIGMDESPFDAVRRKRDSSIIVAFHRLKSGEADAVVSAGNSGATMAAAIRNLGRLKNVSRPGIASVFPTLKGPVVMMDVGANVDCRPQHLFQFGVMASAFSQTLFGIEQPRIGLLSIGEETGKGNLLVKKAHELFSHSPLNFIGNVEGRDTFQGDVDVIVCDGFVGNVCLKLSEGLAEAVIAMLREEIAKSIKAQVGYLFAKDAFSNFRRRVDYAEYGGAPLLGFNGTGIICHGRSNAVAIKNAIRIGAELVRKKVNQRIQTFLDESGNPQAGSVEQEEAGSGL
jgi:phosphate acyltransferase